MNDKAQGQRMTVATKQIDWQFPNDNETTTVDDFKEMVRNSESAPHMKYICKTRNSLCIIRKNHVFL